MNQILRLSLLGTPQVLVGDQSPHAFATYKKAQALLFYLAVTADSSTVQASPHSRDALATLLWGELPDVQAKQNLRNVLPDLRRLVGDHVRIERQTVFFDHTRPYWLDVEVLRRSLQPSPSPLDLAVRQAAVDLYQGEFLHGFYVRDAPAFESWVVEQREQIHTLVVNALTELVGEYARNDQAAAALAANRRLLVLDPWSEPAHRQQMLLLAQTGDRAAALAQYESCRRVLAAEFGMQPLPETTALYEQIRAGIKGRQGEQPETVVRSPAQGLAPSSAAPSSAGAPSGRSANDPGATSKDPLPWPVVGHNLPQATRLYGRQAELARLQQWVSQEGCHLVGIFAIGGQGKTALATTFVRRLAEAASQPNPGGHFRHILWQSLLNAPPLAEVLQEWLYVLSDQRVTTLPTSLDQQFNQLLDYLRDQRCLLILDNLESILQGNGRSDDGRSDDERSGDGRSGDGRSGDGRSNYYRPGYEDYGQLFQRLATSEHHSCLLLTSRERPLEMSQLEEERPLVRSLALSGLPADAGRQMLEGRGLAADLAGLGALVQHYSGNPLALKLAAETVQEIFDGDIAAFLQADALVFDDIRHVLDQQFARLTPLEGEVVRWLAIVREPLSFNALRDQLARAPAPRLLLEAVRSLQRRSLIEKFEQGFGLQNVLLEYTSDRLVEEIACELLDDPVPLALSRLPLSHLNRHALVLAQSKEYVRASQTRQLLQPLAERLVTQLGSPGAPHQLQRQLARLRSAPPIPGYAAANLLHLLLQLGADLRGYDFSRLYLRQAHLRGVSLPQTNFAEAQLIDNVFTEPFGLVYTVAFSPDRKYVAAGTSEGAIYLWRTADQQLAQVIQAHQHAIKQLTFAQPALAHRQWPSRQGLRVRLRVRITCYWPAPVTTKVLASGHWANRGPCGGTCT